MHYYVPDVMSGNDSGWGIFMILFWLAVLVVIVYVVISLLKNHETATNS
jgi:uncharacterized membrane protein